MTYADQCLERAEKAQVIAVQKHYNLEAGCDAWLELQRLDDEMRNILMPEMSHRLKRAIHLLRLCTIIFRNAGMKDPSLIDPGLSIHLKIDELERPLEEK